MASTIHRIASRTAGLAILVVLTGCGDDGDDREPSPSPPAPEVTSADATSTTPVAEPLTITSPAFADGVGIIDHECEFRCT